MAAGKGTSGVVFLSCFLLKSVTKTTFKPKLRMLSVGMPLWSPCVCTCLWIWVHANTSLSISWWVLGGSGCCIHPQGDTSDKDPFYCQPLLRLPRQGRLLWLGLVQSRVQGVCWWGSGGKGGGVVEETHPGPQTLLSAMQWLIHDRALSYLLFTDR